MWLMILLILFAVAVVFSVAHLFAARQAEARYRITIKRRLDAIMLP